jgi:hypothetical protein
MKIGDLVRNIKIPRLEGIVTEVSSYHGIVTFRTKRNTIYSFKPCELEVISESR